MVLDDLHDALLDAQVQVIRHPALVEADVHLRPPQPPPAPGRMDGLPCLLRPRQPPEMLACEGMEQTCGTAAYAADLLECSSAKLLT